MSYYFGLTSPGGGATAPGGADRCWVGKFTSGAAGTIIQGTVCFVSSTTSGASGKVVVLSVTAGEPDTVLAVSDPVAIPAGASTTVFPFTGSPAIAASTEYYLGIVTSDFQADIDNNFSAGAYERRLANGTFSYASPPAIWPGTDISYTDFGLNVAVEVNDSSGGSYWLLVKN